MIGTVLVSSAATIAAWFTANFVGKMRRRGQSEGYRRDWKKAYVKLADGEKMIEYAENL